MGRLALSGGNGKKRKLVTFADRASDPSILDPDMLKGGARITFANL